MGQYLAMGTMINRDGDANIEVFMSGTSHGISAKPIQHESWDCEAWYFIMVPIAMMKHGSYV